MMADKDELTELSQKIEKGLIISFKRLLAFKRYKKTPLIFSKNGKIVAINPNDLDFIPNKTQGKQAYKSKPANLMVNEPSGKTKKGSKS